MTDREVAFNQQINALIVKEGNPHFFYAQMLIGKRLIQQASTGSMKGLVSKSRFESISFIFPPTSLQNEFAQRILAVEKLKIVYRRSLREFNVLFDTLQHRAFRGEPSGVLSRMPEMVR